MIPPVPIRNPRRPSVEGWLDATIEDFEARDRVLTQLDASTGRPGGVAGTADITSDMQDAARDQDAPGSGVCPAGGRDHAGREEAPIEVPNERELDIVPEGIGPRTSKLTGWWIREPAYQRKCDRSVVSATTSTSLFLIDAERRSRPRQARTRRWYRPSRHP